MDRIVIAGSSGSGKTTLAEAISDRLNVTHVELDALHHTPGWTTPTDQEFRSAVADATAGDRWVVDGNYWSKVQDIVWSRANTIVFLDLPRWRVMLQLIPRTLRRVITREELWNGNRESWRNLVSRRPEENILLWAWTTHGRRPGRFEASLTDPRFQHLEVVRLQSRRDIARFTASL